MKFSYKNWTFQAQLDRKRRGARKKVMEMRAAGHSGVNSLAGSQVNITIILFVAKLMLQFLRCSKAIANFMSLFLLASE